MSARANAVVLQAAQGLAAVRRSLATKRFSTRRNVVSERWTLLELARDVSRAEAELRPLCATARGRRGRAAKLACANHARLVQLQHDIVRVLDMLRT